MEAEYRMEEGKYAFYLDGECLMTCEEVAFLVDLGTNGRLMHGEPGPVEARLQLMSAAFRGAGFHKEADDLVVIKGTEFYDAKTAAERAERERALAAGATPSEVDAAASPAR